MVGIPPGCKGTMGLAASSDPGSPPWPNGTGDLGRAADAGAATSGPKGGSSGLWKDLSVTKRERVCEERCQLSSQSARELPRHLR